MKTRLSRKSFRMAIFSGIFSILLLSISIAADSNDNEWHFDSTTYLWAADVEGTSSSGSGFSLDFEDALDHLEMGYSGYFEARKGKWSFLMNPVYIDISGDIARQLDNPDQPADVRVTFKTWVSDFAVAYNYSKTEKSRHDFVFGARYLDMDVSVDVHQFDGTNVLADRTDIEESNWDWVVGVKGEVGINKKWSIPYYIDIGAGDSDLTWNAMVAFSYKFKKMSAVFGYRYLHHDFDDDNIGKIMEDQDQFGPIVGVRFTF